MSKRNRNSKRRHRATQTPLHGEPHGTPHRAQGRTGPREIIRLDTQAIRKKALRDYFKAEKALSKTKEDLSRYHEHDIPGFHRWIHSAFGPLLTRQRELQQAIQEKRNLLIEIQELADRFDLSDTQAYQKAMWRKEHPQEAEEEDRQFAEAQRLAAEQATKEDEKTGKGLDDDDDPFGDDEDDPFGPFGESGIPPEFQEILDYILGNRGHNRPPPGRQTPRTSPAQEKSIKDLYRSIVRRLHPDHHGRMTPAQAELWHEAQEAWRRRDAEALHGVLARCEGGATGVGSHSAVSIIQRLTRQLKDSLRQGKREVRQARQNPAWSYETRIADGRFVRNIRFELTDQTDSLEWDLNELTSILSNLQRQATRTPVRRRRRQPVMNNLQDELPF